MLPLIAPWGRWIEYDHLILTPLTRTNLDETMLVLFNVSSHKPLAICALLYLIKRPCDAAGLRDDAAEYWDMASSCHSALISPGPWETMSEVVINDDTYTVRETTHQERILPAHHARLSAVPFHPPFGHPSCGPSSRDVHIQPDKSWVSEPRITNQERQAHEG